MGFGAVWITPIVDNPDEAFTGGDPVIGDGFFTDRGKTGYHGYWGVNFYRVDEHLPSPTGLDFADLTAGMRGARPEDRARHRRQPRLAGLHDARDQPKFGEIYDKDGTLIADHQNLPRASSTRRNPLHASSTRAGPRGTVGHQRERPARDGLLRRRLLCSGSSRARARSASTRSADAATRSGTSSRARIRERHPGSSCSAKPSTTTPQRSPRTRCRRTAA